MHKIRDGFTLIEVLVAVGISLAILVFVVANYRGSNKDSVLSKEVALVMANLRYAQELTASGKTIKHCSFFTGQECTSNADCKCAPPTDCTPITGSSTPDICTGEILPAGGYAVVFSCTPNGNLNAGIRDNEYPSTVGAPHSPGEGMILPYYGKRAYSIFAELISCKKTVPPESADEQGCFPTRSVPVNPNKPWNADPRISDGLISYYYNSSRPGLRGDTLENMYFLSNDVEVRGIQVTSKLDTKSKCEMHSASPVFENSKWYNNSTFGVPNTNSTAFSGLSYVGDQSNYPIQAVIRFLPPDGRIVQISDNVASSPPATGASIAAQWDIDPENPWAKAEIMLGVVKDTSKCRLITVKQSGEISQRVDYDCAFGTAK